MFYDYSLYTDFQWPLDAGILKRRRLKWTAQRPGMLDPVIRGTDEQTKARSVTDPFLEVGGGSVECRALCGTRYRVGAGCGQYSDVVANVLSVHMKPVVANDSRYSVELRWQFPHHGNVIEKY